jgi:phage shock protein A
MPGPMADERMIRALGRLEQALLRAEAAGAAAEESGAAATAARESLQSELARLETRHERLRASAASAVTQLDGLIAATPVETNGG